MTQSAVVTSSRTTMNGKKSAVWLALTICLSIIMLIRLGLISRKFDRLLSHFHPEFRVDSAFIPSLNTSTNPAELTATWDMTLLAINSDDKLIVDYYAVQVWLYYERSTEYNAFVLATTILPPFVLNPPRNQTRMSFRLATLRAYVGDEVVKNITEAAAAGRVTTAFGLKVVTEYRLRMNEVNTTVWGTLRFFCNEICFLGFSKNNNQTRSDSAGTCQSKSCERDENYSAKAPQRLSRLW